MEVTLWCTDTFTGALLTPAADAVTTACPTREAGLHVTKVESQMPAQISPLGETVTRAGFDVLKVNVVVTGPPAELSAFGARGVDTSPATRETSVCDTVT
jgi:hypothetical protein